MKKLFTLLGLSALLLTGLFAQDVTAEDRAKGLAHLEKTRAGVLAAAAGLSEAQLNFKAAPEKWSIAQVLEHIASAEDLFMGLIQGQVMTAPPRPEGEDVKAIDDLILTAIPDRTQKRSAPEPLVPTNRYGTAAEALKHFGEGRAKTIAFLKDTAGLRGHAIDSPLGKKLDAYQWLLFSSAHSERHTKQILEVKADPRFPEVVSRTRSSRLIVGRDLQSRPFLWKARIPGLRSPFFRHPEPREGSKDPHVITAGLDPSLRLG